MLFIFLVHAYQATLSNEDIVIRIIYGFAALSGVAIFMFVMGMGTVYSKRSEPKTLAKSGMVMPACAVIALAWWIFTVMKYGVGDELYSYLCVGYTQPDLFHVVASIAHDLFFAGLLYLGDGAMKKSGVIVRFYVDLTESSHNT